MEYEPITDSEDERPPQAGGESAETMTKSDSDSDFDLTFINKTNLSKNNEIEISNYYGDVSDDDTKHNDWGVQPNNDSSTKKIAVPCNTCKTCESKSQFRYCKSCWKTRKEWIGSHKRKLKNRNKNPVNKSEEPTEIITVQEESKLCILCRSKPKDTIFVHNKMGHQVSCYPCAKKLWKKRKDCPICRRTVEKIVKVLSV